MVLVGWTQLNLILKQKVSIMKERIKKKVLYLIGLLTQMVVAEKEPHWSDDWDKAEYRIVKKSNDTGRVSYRPQRCVKNHWSNLIHDTYAYDTESDARFSIDRDRNFYKQAYIREQTENIEIIEIEIA